MVIGAKLGKCAAVAVIGRVCYSYDGRGWVVVWRVWFGGVCSSIYPVLLLKLETLVKKIVGSVGKCEGW